jgi:hypothetical protein
VNSFAVEPVVELVRPFTLTVTTTVPADSAGEVAVIEVDELKVTAVAATEPNFTVAPDAKPVPVMVTAVPPEVDPDVGDIEATDGEDGGGGVAA